MERYAWVRGRWMKCLGRFKMQTLTNCGAKITSTRTAVGQFKGQFNGAMERYIWVRFAGKLTTCQTPHIAPVSISVGRWNVTHVGSIRVGKLTSCHANTWRRSANQWGDGTLHVGSICGKAHRLPDNAHSNGQYFSGALDERQWKVQDASTHILRRKS